MARKRHKGLARFKREIERSKGTRALAYVIIPAFLVWVLVFTIITVSGSRLDKMKDRVSEMYPEGMREEVYVTADIVTAKVDRYEDGMVYTDIGAIEVSQEPKVDVILVYKDINGRLKDVKSIHDNIEDNIVYVTKEFKEGTDGRIVVHKEEDKETYKEYIKAKEEIELAEKKHSRTKKIWGSILVICIVFLVGKEMRATSGIRRRRVEN